MTQREATFSATTKAGEMLDGIDRIAIVWDEEKEALMAYITFKPYDTPVKGITEYEGKQVETLSFGKLDRYIPFEGLIIYKD